MQPQVGEWSDFHNQEVNLCTHVRIIHGLQIHHADMKQQNGFHLDPTDQHTREEVNNTTATWIRTLHDQNDMPLGETPILTALMNMAIKSSNTRTTLRHIQLKSISAGRTRTIETGEDMSVTQYLAECLWTDPLTEMHLRS